MFYRQFAVTIATATVISLFVSLTLSPALCAMLFKPHTGTRRPRSALMAPGARLLPPASTGASTRWRGGYGRLVRGLASRVGRRCSSSTWRCIGFAGWFVPHLPTGFIPDARPRHPDRLAAAAAGRFAGAHRRRWSSSAIDITLQDAGRRVLQRLHRPQRRHLHDRHQCRPDLRRARRLRGARTLAA